MPARYAGARARGMPHSGHRRPTARARPGCAPTRAAKAAAVYDEPFWRRDGLAGAGASRLGPLQEVHDMCGPGGEPTAVFGFAPSALVGPGAEERGRAQLGWLLGPRGAGPRSLTITDWSRERWTTPPGAASRRAGHSLHGHPLLQAPALAGRLHWASTETAAAYAGHVEGALVAAERVVAAVTARTTPG